MQNRKHTAWKKNRKFGDIMGGRERVKLADNIFNRTHNLQPPSDNDPKPIFIVENPSKDFYFPVTIEEIQTTLDRLPTEHTEFLTHIWLQKVKKKDYMAGNRVQAAFICGSKVYLIKLYAVPKDNKMLFGTTKPSNKHLTFFKPYCTDLRHDKNGWFLQWTDKGMKQYFLEKLLMHEIGHCVDYMYHRHWSKANSKQTEDFADNYAMIWRNNIRLGSGLEE